MEKPTHHVLLCASFRVAGDPKGICHKKGSTGLLQYIEEEVLDRGLDVLLSTTGCLKQCEKGPVMVVYPQNTWYGGVESEAVIDEILDAIENGGTADSYLL
jgi:(2Fe-2S) ferredoxin